MKKALSILILAILVLASCGKEEVSEAKKDLPAFKTIKGVECVLIKAGSFVMGLSETADEEDYGKARPQHNVIITKDFYLGQYEVTNAQYCEFLNAKKIDEGGKYQTKNDGEQVMIKTHDWGVKYTDGQWLPQEGYEDFPVGNVSWYGADEFCRWAGGKLPTEAQWEYACKAGRSSRFFFGDDESYYCEYAWYDLISGSKSHKVGEKRPNPWGLYDIYSNLWEWCSDWLDEGFYANSPVEDPEQTSDVRGNYEKSRRGGSWYNGLYNYTVIRGGTEPDFHDHSIGFRFCYIP